MRSNFFVTALVVIFFISMSRGQEEIKEGVLTIIINGFENDEGKAMIALSNSREDYETQDQAYQSNQIKINDNVARWIINNLPFGEYAIKVYHDEDDDDEMDTNFLGVPSEDFGFSNNARGRFGPASWEDAKFLFNSSKDTVYIKVE
jgi:uncharacterized protein (DUF2141 family)